MRFGDWLESNSKKTGSRIILALDVAGDVDTRLERASALVSDVGDRIAAVKIHWYLLLPFGALRLSGLLRQCHEAGLPVIADLKLNDIGHTNIEVVDTLFSSGFDAVIANPFVGYKEGMQETMARAREREKGVILLVYMSHAGAREGYGLRVAGKPLYITFAEKARRWGADGVVVSAGSPPVIRAVRKVLGRGQLILSPGIGAQGGDAEDAAKAGADYLIVGRAITDSPSPRRAVDSLNATVGKKS